MGNYGKYYIYCESLVNVSQLVACTPCPWGSTSVVRHCAAPLLRPKSLPRACIIAMVSNIREVPWHYCTMALGRPTAPPTVSTRVGRRSVLATVKADEGGHTASRLVIGLAMESYWRRDRALHRPGNEICSVHHDKWCGLSLIMRDTCKVIYGCRSVPLVLMPRALDNVSISIVRYCMARTGFRFESSVDSNG